MINFEGLVIKGFGSVVEEIVYPLNQKGITSIQGENGSGKSTFLNAFIWTLFGKTLKRSSTIEPWRHVAASQYVGTICRVIFTKGKNHYEVIRCKNYTKEVEGGKGGNRIIFLENNKPFPERDKVDIQHKIEEILNCSFELFKNAITFGQNTNKLMQEDGPTKKKILEEIFNGGFIQEAEKVAKTKYAAYKDEKWKLDEKINHLEQLLERLQNQVEQLQNQQKNFDIEKTQRIKQVKAKKSNHRSSVKEQKRLKLNLQDSKKNLLKKIKGLNSQIDEHTIDQELKLNFAILTKKGKVETIEKEKENLLKKYSQNSQKCYACGEPLTQAKVKKFRQQIEENIREQNTKLKLLKEQITKNEKKYSKIKNKAEKHAQLMGERKTYENQLAKTATDMEVCKTKIEFHIQRFGECQKELQKEENRTFDSIALKSLLQETLQQQKNLQSLKEANQKITKKLDLYGWAIKDPLSNSGLKAFIFNTSLKSINTLLQQNYSHILGFTVNLYIDLNTTTKSLAISIHQNDNLVPYDDLSGGQKQLVDIALVFAINDLIMETKPMSILWLDEVFESLSKTNTEKVVEIILQKAMERSVYVISHNPDFLNMGTKSIQVYLDKNNHTQIS